MIKYSSVFTYVKTKKINQKLKLLLVRGQRGTDGQEVRILDDTFLYHFIFWKYVNALSTYKKLARKSIVGLRYTYPSEQLNSTVEPKENLS